MKESDIQRDILQYLKKAGIFHWRTPNLTYGKRKNIVTKGVADILALFAGKLVAIEVKKPGGILSEDQKTFHAEILRNGGLSLIAYSTQDAVTFFRGLHEDPNM